MTNKDVVFACVLIAWLIVGVAASLIFPSIGSTMTNFGFISGMCILILIKNTNKRFGNWLEKPFKKEKEKE